MLKVINVSKSYKNKKVVSSVSFDVMMESFLGL